ncbi:MAG: hypothetical protein D8M26_16595 [Ignavibacteriae bacterium]|nr:MAG: hypothetical protein EDM72_09575 [Chlorobiota bacterium]MBL1124489.1 hypothetical protein [Ignavibacteriota bacterium]MCE7857725.1 hypothetical protein [Ignavibacteria bacterium CHB3]
MPVFKQQLLCCKRSCVSAKKSNQKKMRVKKLIHCRNFYEGVRKLVTQKRELTSPNKKGDLPIALTKL